MISSFIPFDFLFIFLILLMLLFVICRLDPISIYFFRNNNGNFFILFFVVDFNKPDALSVELENIKITWNNYFMIAFFTQKYHSGSINTTTTKMIHFQMGKRGLEDCQGSRYK